MSKFEFSIGEELLEIIANIIGEDGLKAFIKDFSEWADFVLEDDEDYIEDSESESESEYDSEGEVFGIEVEEEYETIVDENGFHSLKECKVKSN